MTDIFISYRRQDSQEICKDLFIHLVKALPDFKIFMDVNTIDAGNKWRDELEMGIEKCDVLLVMIGPNWSSIQNNQVYDQLYFGFVWVCFSCSYQSSVSSNQLRRNCLQQFGWFLKWVCFA